MLGKIITLIIVFAVIYLVFFKMLRKKDSGNKEIENFVECDKCGTFVDMKSAVLSNGRYVCRDCIKAR
ncbi:hypothetical protein CCAL13119_05840 [Campylobacter sp. RM13119]|uniref:PP0621 family protein n=1 Tax=Campylobacter TaxID=194 RepID=UPI0014727691|nr:MULTISPECIES: PP0621 family protein [unclassified Campylobacter]MBE3022394.1 hypothetical protein [Campylobacter sp. 7477a]MBE3606482.1 hypothetical protein [Campylobacter sp. RM13119]MBE3610117.1 hypothetical protein [Campylobacter sp. RM12916]